MSREGQYVAGHKTITETLFVKNKHKGNYGQEEGHYK